MSDEITKKIKSGQGLTDLAPFEVVGKPKNIEDAFQTPSSKVLNGINYAAGALSTLSNTAVSSPIGSKTDKLKEEWKQIKSEVKKIRESR